MRILSGIQPSGSFHIGNYFGMMKQCIEFQNTEECLFLIVDYHALTSTPNPKLLSERIINAAVDFIACGLDPEKSIFFRQSDILQIPELAWILSCHTPMGLIERCHSYKDKIANGIMPNCGLFFYPVLMAADILLFKSNIIPVGKDQKQHVEVAKDIAIRFNNAFGNVFSLPESRIIENLAIVPGIDGRKMSKSYGNTISIFGEEKQLKKLFMKIITDSKTPEEPKDPEKCSIFALYKLFASEKEIKDMAERYKKGPLMYGVAKQELFDIYWEYFAPMRQKRKEILNNIDYVYESLKKGAERSLMIAMNTMQEVKQKIGLR